MLYVNRINILFTFVAYNKLTLKIYEKNNAIGGTVLNDITDITGSGI